MPAGFVLGLCARVWGSQPNSLTECKVPGAVWDGSPAVPLLAPVLSLVKQSKLQKRAPP